MANDSEFITLNIEDVLSGTGMEFMVIGESKDKDNKKEDKKNPEDNENTR